MFGLFKRKTRKERLQAKYQSLMNDAYRLSKINRSQSDQKYFEADQVLKEIESNDKDQKQNNEKD